MKFVGAHVSISGGVEHAPINAMELGAKAFAMFTKNQRQWNSKPLTRESINTFNENLKLAQIKPENVLPHDSYLINLGNNNLEKREKSYKSFLDEIKRVEQLGLKMLNFHPGSHLKIIDEETCLDHIATEMNKAISETSNAVLVIENTAGQGSNMGYKLEHLAYIIDKISDKNRVGICIDTCHAYAAGYDIKSRSGLNKFIKNFDQLIGIKYLKAMHLNDSLKGLGSRVDRHKPIGEGTLGISTFKEIMINPVFEEIPLILETPDENLWASEIKQLYSFIT